MLKGVRRTRLYRIMLLLVASASFAFVCILIGRWANAIMKEPSISVSHESGVYHDTIYVSVEKCKVDCVYYKTNGSDEQHIYTGPIELAPSNDGNAYSFSFYFLLDDGNISEPITKNYLVLSPDRNVETDFIAMVWGDEKDLFDYESGLLVRGKAYDEYMANTPDAYFGDAMWLGNYYSDAELPVYSVMFDNHGTEIISQNCGLGVTGNYTRSKAQQSIRLTARYAYDDKNEFSYPFFEDRIAKDRQTIVGDYHSLTLHNSGDDNGYGFIRNALINSLALQNGFEYAVSARSIALWINNSYQGIFWLQNTYDKRYFSETFGEYEGTFVKLSGTLCNMSEDETDELNRSCAREYNSFCLDLIGKDANNEAVYKEIESVVDVGNFLEYMAIEYYVANCDWPDNNVKVFRYVVGENEDYISGTVFDGKYRFVLQDLDYGLGLKNFGSWGYSVEDSVLPILLDDNNSNTVLFRTLMRRKECREKFIGYLFKLENGSFKEENASIVLNRMTQSQWSELEYMLSNTEIMKKSVWEYEFGTDEDSVLSERNIIVDFLQRRPMNVFFDLQMQWDIGNPYTIVVDDSSPLNICINGLSINEASWTGKIPVTISGKHVGINVEGWEINGKYLAGEEITFYPEKYAKDDSYIEVIPVWKTNSEPELRIDKINISNGSDFVVLKNEGLRQVYLEDYAVSDDENELLKAVLPSVILAPGDEFIVYAKNYKQVIPDNSFQVDFSWSKGESVILSHLSNGVVDMK